MLIPSTKPLLITLLGSLQPSTKDRSSQRNHMYLKVNISRILLACVFHHFTQKKLIFGDSLNWLYQVRIERKLMTKFLLAILKGKRIGISEEIAADGSRFPMTLHLHSKGIRTIEKLCTYKKP